MHPGRLAAAASVAACVVALLGGCTGQPPADAGAAGTPSSPPPSPARPSTAPTPVSAPMPAPGTGWGPSLDEWQRAGEIVAAMDTAAQAGQVIVATYPGTDLPVELVTELGLAGVILLGDNVPSGPTGAEALAADLDRLQASDQRPYPVLVAVDQEGGPVARLGDPVTEFPPAMALGAADDPSLARRAAAAAGAELRSLGITMVFAPVADVTVGPTDPTIGVRSPGADPALVARTVRAQVEGYADAGVVPVVKHFPGHGSVPADSHVELPVQEAALADLRGRDLIPFGTAVRSGAPAVMVAHIDVRSVDPGVPSTLSPPVVSLLRDDLGFAGVVVTDSLLMAAVADRVGPGQAVVSALAAGADLLLMPADARAARDAIVAAVEQDRLAPRRLAEAAQRVVALQLGQAPTAGGAPPLGSAAALSREVSAAAVTRVSGPCRGPLVPGAIRVLGGTEQDRARLAAAAQAAGLQVGSGPSVVLLGGPLSTASGDVVVALDAPYGLAASQAAIARLALFGRTPAAFDVLVSVLTGETQAPGRLPVAVPGLAATPC